MIGIYDCFGYGDGYEVPFDERYKLIKDAGFDSVMLWWSDKFGRGNGYQEDVKFARNISCFMIVLVLSALTSCSRKYEFKESSEYHYTRDLYDFEQLKNIFRLRKASIS